MSKLRDKVVFGGYSFSPDNKLALDNTARAMVDDAARQDAIQQFRTICQIFLDRTYEVEPDERADPV